MVIPMNADPWTDRLSEYVDDELAPAERLQLEQHLLDCARCREIVDELREVAADAKTLEDTPPATDLWPAISAALPRASSRGWRVTLSLPQALAASVLLMAVSGLAVWTFAERPGSTPARSPSALTPQRARPRRSASPTSGTTARWPISRNCSSSGGRGWIRAPPRSIERNLATIDRAITEAMAALQQEPADTYLAAHVAEQRRRKLSLSASGEHARALRRAYGLTPKEIVHAPSSDARRRHRHAGGAARPTTNRRGRLAAASRPTRPSTSRKACASSSTNVPATSSSRHGTATRCVYAPNIRAAPKSRSPRATRCCASPAMAAAASTTS